MISNPYWLLPLLSHILTQKYTYQIKKSRVCAFPIVDHELSTLKHTLKIH